MVRLGAALLIAVLAAFSALAQSPVTIVIRDHQFVPAEVTIPAATKVEISIKNEQNVPAEFESSSLHREKVIGAGATASVFVGPLAAGRYEFYDDFHPATRGFIVVR